MATKNIVGLIPARGGSKRIHRKNLYLLDGIPLINHTILSAKQSKHLTYIFVSTEDDEIAETSKLCGAEIIKRPARLATDTASSIDVLKHAILYIQKKGLKIDALVLLQPTSPLRTFENIDKSIELFLKEDVDSVITVTPFDFKLGGLVNLSQSNDLNFKFTKEKFTRMQDTEELYWIDGCVYVNKPDFLLKSKELCFNKDDCKAIIISKNNSLEIDTLEDVDYIQYLIHKNKIGGN